MPAPRIKLCGLTDPAALDAAIAAREDFAGFNFYVYTTYSLQFGWKIKTHATEKGRYKRTRNRTHVT